MVTGTLRRLIRAQTVPIVSGNSIHGNLRSIFAAAEKSVHGESRVVSTSAGILWGFIVVDAGTAGTMTVYDNPSAASGVHLRDVVPAELVRGAFIYCGAYGIPASNGIYVQLGGTVAPTVCAIFEGTHPAVVHDESASVRYIDGTSGNDAWDGTSPTYTGGTTGPRKTWPNSWTSGKWHVYCKWGTVIAVSNSAMVHQGTDWLVEPYGDDSLAKPLLQLSATKTNNFSFNATSGIVEFRDIDIISLLSTRKSGGGISASGGALALFTRCHATNFTSGLLYGGEYSRIVDCGTTRCTQALQAGNSSFAAARFSLIDGGHYEADSDTYSLHDGTGTGKGNVCFCSELLLDPAFGTGSGGIIPENVVDINAQFKDTVVALCELWGSEANNSTYTISGDDFVGDGVSILSNIIHGGHSACLSPNTENWTSVGNALISGENVGAGAGCLRFAAANSIGNKVYYNYLFMNSDSSRPVCTWQDGSVSTGDMRNNIIVSEHLSQNIYNIGSGAIAGWTFGYNDYYAPGVTGSTEFANVDGGGGAQSFATFNTNHEGGTGLNVDPNLDAEYKLPAGSPLIGAGDGLGGVCYLGLHGPVWIYGPPSIGPHDPQWGIAP